MNLTYPSPRAKFKVVLLALVATPPLALSQPPAPLSHTVVAKPLAFEVVSINRDNSALGPPSIQSPQNGDTVTLSNMSPRMIIGFAFDLARHDDVDGLPPWTDTEAYDITAKVAESDLTAFHQLLPRQRNPMLQPLLADRFHLKFHYESRPLPAYKLVVAQGGSKLTEAHPGLTPNGRQDPGGIRTAPDQITSNAATITVLLDALAQQLGRPVIDGTGLIGHYSFTLRFAPVQPSADAQADAAPSLFTAIQNQLGLKLESIKAPVQVLVIDHIERPSQN